MLAPPWEKVLQPPGPSKPTKATLRVKAQTGAGLKIRNLQSGGQGVEGLGPAPDATRPSPVFLPLACPGRLGLSLSS